jgi:tetratricopeptide (TPR) repeat protein
VHKPDTESSSNEIPLDFSAPGRYGAEDFDQAAGHFSAGRLDQAADICRRILSKPTEQQAPVLHMLGIILAEKGATTEGLRLLEQACLQDDHNPALHFSRGRILVRTGNPAAAVEAFKLSARLNSSDPRIPQRLALALLECSRFTEAEAVARAALEIWPASSELLDALGMVLMALGRTEEARRVLVKACQIDPGYADAYGNLAIAYEQSSQLDSALEVISDGLKRWPMHRTLKFVRARCLRRCGEYAKAQIVLLELLDGEHTHKLHIDIEFELGWCADGMDNASEAFQHFTEANLLAERSLPYSAARGEDYLRMLASLHKRFDRTWVNSWQTLPSPAKANEPVFIIGFPRSGTTLLDTMLGAHPDLRLLEEQPTIQAMLEILERQGDDYPMALATLTAEQQSRLRTTYFQAANCGLDAPVQQRLLDKSPFNTAHAGLIHRVFPEALLIFVVRHPCDVCLSCFMNNFELNSGTQHFTRLETTVRLYCQAMALWLRYVDVLPLRYQMLRYEDLVENTEKELRHLQDRIGVGWSGEVLQHAAYARARGHISTPSYAQVHQPVYKDARYRWRRYADFMQPFLKDLHPYIEVFGYAS